MSVKNDCPMCAEAPSVNGSICKECRDYCNDVSAQLSFHLPNSDDEVAINIYRKTDQRRSYINLQSSNFTASWEEP